ncbi:hypothetical protein H4I96_02299 [Botrytis cinerea]
MSHCSSFFFFHSVSKRKMRLAMTRPTPNPRGVGTFTTVTVTVTVTVRLYIPPLPQITPAPMSNALGIVMDNQAPGHIVRTGENLPTASPKYFLPLHTDSRKTSPISNPIQCLCRNGDLSPAEHFTSSTSHQLISSDTVPRFCTSITNRSLISKPTAIGTALKKYNRAYDTTDGVSVLPGSSGCSHIIQSVLISNS